MRLSSGRWFVVVFSSVLLSCGTEEREPPAGPECAEGRTECDGKCVDLKSDADHCGRCDHSCGGGACVEGECRTECPAGTEPCEGSCVDTSSDPAHCGGCGRACADDRVCRDGFCACPEGLRECDGRCVNTSTDARNCGACGETCFEGQSCIEGTCVCDGGLEACDGACVDVLSSTEHCGACGESCFEGQSCVEGRCVCDGGLEACDGACVDVLSSFEHCGSCGESCFEGQSCVEGKCVCDGGLEACDGACVDVLNSFEHCGACGESCFEGQICHQGACVCTGFQLECSGECVDPSRDVRHCGGCGAACVQRANAEPPQCVAGDCATICLAGFDDCDGDEETGCEVALATDASHCGVCGFDCAALPNVASASCANFRCDFVCLDGFADCDELDDTGCEASLAGPTTCGSCGNDCTALPHVATATCVEGACGIVDCASGWLDCDGDPANGCETDAFLVDSCGACNTSCYACGASGCTVAEAVVTTLGYGTCAILGDGGLWCWGANNFGLVDDSGNDVPIPKRIPLPGEVTQVAGLHHLCAVLDDGTVACWGSNGSGQLGDGTFFGRSTPALVPQLGDVVSVGTGNTHTCAVDGQGQVLCWGVNYAGQLGFPPASTMFEPSPTLVPGLSNVQKIAVGFDANCALLGDGTVRCWGGNLFGQVGNGSASDWAPISDPGLTNVVDVAMGFFNACALLASGSVECWGFNVMGQLGFPATGPEDFSPTPTPVPGIAGATKVGIGFGHACALLQSGELTCWGSNLHGEIGDGTASGPNTPPHTLNLQNVVDFSTGNHATCAVLGTGVIHCWGRNDRGQVGDGTTSDVLAPTQVDFP